MTPTARPSSACRNDGGAGAAAAGRSSSSERSSSASARSCATLRIFSRLGLGILAFGRFSGKLIFGFRSGDSVPLTRRQREILDFISGHITERGFAPSFEEIAARFAFRSLATVHEHLTNLRSEEHTSELQSRLHLVCRLLLEKKKKYRHEQSDDRV